MAFRLFKLQFTAGVEYTNDLAGALQMFTDFVDCFAGASHSADSGWSYDTDYCPENKPVLLTPGVKTYAACLKHVTGAKLMLVHSMYGLAVRDDSTGYGNYYDPGFLFTKLYNFQVSSSWNSAYYNKIGGIMAIYLSPDSVSDGAAWHLDKSIKDVAFYDSRATPVVFPLVNWSSSTSTSYYSTNVFTPQVSATTGTVEYIAALVDPIKPVIGIIQCGNISNVPSIYFIGELGVTNVFGSALTSAKSGWWVVCGRAVNSTTAGAAPEGIQDTSGHRNRFGAFNATGASTGYINGLYVESISSGANYRYTSPAVGFSVAIDPELFQFSTTDGLVTGQTYNNGQWYTLGVSTSYRYYFSYSGNTDPTSTTTTGKTVAPIIAWDKEFNGDNIL